MAERSMVEIAREQAPGLPWREGSDPHTSWEVAEFQAGIVSASAARSPRGGVVVEAGATPRAFGEEPAAWLARVLPMFRKMKHPGNHVYTWNLRGKTEPGKGYPKERG